MKKYKQVYISKSKSAFRDISPTLIKEFEDYHNVRTNMFGGGPYSLQDTVAPADLVLVVPYTIEGNMQSQNKVYVSKGVFTEISYCLKHDTPCYLAYEGRRESLFLKIVNIEDLDGPWAGKYGTVQVDTKSFITCQLYTRHLAPTCSAEERARDAGKSKNRASTRNLLEHTETYRQMRGEIKTFPDKPDLLILKRRRR